MKNIRETGAHLASFTVHAKTVTNVGECWGGESPGIRGKKNNPSRKKTHIMFVKKDLKRKAELFTALAGKNLPQEGG